MKSDGGEVRQVMESRPPVSIQAIAGSLAFTEGFEKNIAEISLTFRTVRLAIGSRLKGREGKLRWKALGPGR